MILKEFDKKQLINNGYSKKPLEDLRSLMYKDLQENAIPNGWCYYKLFVKDQKLITEEYNFDNMWYQSIYGIYLALDYKSEHNIELIEKFLDGSEKFLKETDNIFLRDNSKKCIEKYKNGEKNLEASKDQIIGFVCGLFMIFYYTKNFTIRKRIRNIIKKIAYSLLDHGYMLYNEKEKRFYSYAWYCILHHYGLSYAFDYVLRFDLKYRIKRFFYKHPPILDIVHNLIFIALEMKRNILDKNLLLANINVFNIPILKDQKWYQDMLGRDEFSCNLTFFEFLIAGTINKKQALKIIKTLEKESVRYLYHLNLASLYFYLKKKWKILTENSIDEFYKKVLEKDNVLYPIKIPNNNLNICCSTDDTVNNFIEKNYNGKFPENWGVSKDCDKDLKYLLSKDNCSIDTGLPYLARKLLKS